MEENQPEIYDCDDEILGQMLARLFSEGHDEVEIQHPTDGPVVVTRKDFEKHVANLSKVANMSPAERLEANKRVKNIKNSKQIRFRTAMITAKVHVVDIEDDDNFGKNIEGEALDIDGMTFVPVSDYLKGIELQIGEIGAFVDVSERRPPVRIKQRD